MKKSLLIISLLLGCVVFGPKVLADEYSYINDNGLVFDQFQYEAMVGMLDEEKVANMSEEEYDFFDVSNINYDNFEYTTSESGISTFSTLHETRYKKLGIGKSCNSTRCYVSVTNTWKINPSVRSYDMIGVRLSSATFYNSTRTFMLVSGGNVTSESGRRTASNGAAGALKLPSSGDVDYAAMSVFTSTTGAVYGSYQHAVRNITLSKALDFSFTSTGIGGVFDYADSLEINFDEMAGVNILLGYVA